MCGICGILNKDRSDTVPKRYIEAMNRSLTHRGPDDGGFFIEKNVAMANRRLSIIDLSTGRQPIFNEDESKVIVYNGEIYNYLELREMLIKSGHRFRTRSDTEVILHLFEEYHERCVDYLNGMFAVAIFDRKERTLFLARDRLGIKPLYYCQGGERFLFASEIKAILLDESVEKELDYQALADFFCLSYIPAPKTLFRRIRKLPPGSYLYLKDGRVSLREYWRPPLDEGISGFTKKDYQECLVELITAAVKRRLISDVPIGAFLSGGVDSSLVVGMMSKLKDESIETFSMGTERESHNELPYARAVSEHCGTLHHEKVLMPDIHNILPTLVAAFDQPFADSSFVPTYYVSKLARERVTVALSGDGGDELFGGYNRYIRALKSRRYDIIPHFVKVPMAKLSSGLSAKVRGTTRLRHMAMDEEVRYYDMLCRFPGGLKDMVFSGDLRRHLNGYHSSEVFLKYFVEAKETDDYLKKIQYVDLRTYLVDNNLEKVDKMSMLNSLEVRVPLLDHTVVEFALRVPSEFNIVEGEKKSILKEIAARYVPREVVFRPKHGFSIPVSFWFRDSLHDYTRGILTEKRTLERGLLDPRGVTFILDRHKHGLEDYSNKIWNLLVFELFMRSYESGVPGHAN